MDNMSNKGSAMGRSEEEVAWDAEFADMKQPKAWSVNMPLGGIARTMLRLPIALAKLPASLVPEETSRHARAAVRESFLVVRSLFSAVADGIENMLSDQRGTAPTVKGPQGTWGTGRHSMSASAPPPGRVKRIEVQDEVSEAGGGDGSGAHITIDDLGQSAGEDVEGRGLRADIDY